MNFLKHNLTLVAFFAAVLTAFAFNSPQLEPESIKRALDPQTQEWVDIQNQVEGQDFLCNEAETICTAEFDLESGQMIPESQVDGEYEPL